MAPRLRLAATVIHDTRTKPGQAPSSSSSEFQTPAGQLSATTCSTADGLLLMLFFALRGVLRGEAVASSNAFVLLCQNMMQLSVGPNTKKCVPLLHILMSMVNTYR
ncbi:hypothetical protein Trisim1_011983 [Trichoderma cf. simile WF8]